MLGDYELLLEEVLSVIVDMVDYRGRIFILFGNRLVLKNNYFLFYFYENVIFDICLSDQDSWKEVDL